MINERIPYDRSASRMRRIASFLGSTDRYEFLSDEAGSVRWLCFLVDYIDFNYSEKINVDDLWAQAYSYYLAGRNKFNFQLTRDEIFESENFNLQFYIKGEEHEAILACFDRGCQNNHDAHITSTDAIRLFRTYTSLQTNRMSAVSVGKAFRLLGFVAQNKYNNAQRYSVKGYYVRFKDKHFFNSINI